jgi:hypothetical protein
MQNCNYKCIVTHERFNVIHHLYGFDLILEEVFNETGITKKRTISEYTFDELNLIKEKCIEIHNQHPLGVCLSTDIHELFHKMYGRGKNTPEQFTEFLEQLKLENSTILKY